MDNEAGASGSEAELHPLQSEAGRAMLRDLQDSASAAEWHEAVSRIFGYLFVCAAEGRSITDPRLVVWRERIMAAIASGPPGGKRRPGMVRARADADFLRRMLGPFPTRIGAKHMLFHDEMEAQRMKVQDSNLARRRALENAAKRVDAAARAGLKISVRPKRN